MGDGGYSPDLVPRLCHIVRWSDFNGYGFNLHAEKGKAGQFIGKVDKGSPAEAAGLKDGDRIVEVNGTNIGNENHQQVVGRIKVGGEETRLLVVDPETDQHYKEEKKVVRGDLPEVKFMTAARDEDEASPQHAVETSVVAAVVQDRAEEEEVNSAEGQAAMGEEVVAGSELAPRLCHLCKWPDFDGYGFNLHAEKDKPGQYIGLVDPDSPAETGGLREGDRIVEVNGDNIETCTHTVVIGKIKSGGDRTSMLVVDRAADEHFKARGLTVSSAMPGVQVINTPPRLTEGVSGTVMQAEATRAVAAAAVATYQWDSSEQPTSGFADSDNVDYPPPPEEAPPPEPWGLDEGESDLPPPTVDLDLEEATESMTAVAVQEVESAPAPQEIDFNGTEAEEMAREVAAVSMGVTPEEGQLTSGSQLELEQEEEVVGGGVVELNPYEEVDVSASTTAVAVSYEEEQEKVEGGSSKEENKTEEGDSKADTVESQPGSEAAKEAEDESEAIKQAATEEEAKHEEKTEADRAAAEVSTQARDGERDTTDAAVVPEPAGDAEVKDGEKSGAETTPEPQANGKEPPREASLGTTTNGINGGAVVESQVEAAKMTEPPQAVIHTSSNTVAYGGGGDDLNLNLSAAEMKERLKSRKKQDPRQNKTSFESKYKMFEKM